MEGMGEEVLCSVVVGMGEMSQCCVMEGMGGCSVVTWRIWGRGVVVEGIGEGL